MNKDQLTARAEELGLDVQALHAANKNGTATNADLKKAIADAEAKLPPAPKAPEADMDKEAKKAAKEKVMSKGVAPATWKDTEGRVWFFKPDAPKTINIDGRPMSQSEILDSEDVISELAYGNSSFLTQKY